MSVMDRLGRIDRVRSVWLFGIGGVVGLAMAGYGLFTAQGTVSRSLPPEDIALVNHRPILRSDYLAQLAQVYGVSLAESSKAQRDQILHDMVHEELFVQRGLELDMPGSDPDTRTALVAAVGQQVVADVATLQPTDQMLRAFYAGHQADYMTLGTMKLHDLVPVADSNRGTMGDAADALRRGADLADTLSRYGLKESGALTDEEFYFAAKIHLGDALFAIASGLPDHAVAGPLGDVTMPHLLVMKHNVPPVPQSFEIAREHVLNDYRAAETKRLTDQEYRFLEDRSDIVIDPDFR
jgi:hypothetical protein